MYLLILSKYLAMNSFEEALHTMMMEKHHPYA